MAEVAVGLGANVGSPADNLRAAVVKLRRTIEIIAVSSLYLTEPVGLREQPFFFNAVLVGRTNQEPRELIELFGAIEQGMGRSRDVPMGPRTVDLDLLLYGYLIIEEPDLRVPHVRMAERRFVLAPLAEIAPDMVHPVLASTAARLLDALPETESVERVVDEDWPPA
jgi:2-amino-4-hydroxy-6-hydroxymethyldihydropteridine diphosphokinase